VRQALQQLENEGLVQRSQGRGTFVGRPKLANDFLSLSILHHIEGSEIRLIHLKLLAQTPSLAVKLNLQRSEQVYELRRTVVVHGEPLMLITSWLPASLFPDLDDKDLAGVPIRKTVGRYFDLHGYQQHKEVEVTIIDEVDSEYLQVNAGAPALLVTYLNTLMDGTPFEYRKLIVRGDRCKYYADLRMPDPLL
jgi:GntR family transcriptional regulator